jgi:hypothetical protein
MRLPAQSVTTNVRGRSSLALIATALALARPSSASAAAFSARLSAPRHSPTAGKAWVITVTATHGRTKLSGSVRYQFLFQGEVVSTQPGHSFTRGVYRDKLLFTGDAVGHALTLRVVVRTSLGTVNLNWAVQARA